MALNKTRKGYTKELMARKELEKHGYFIAFKSQRVKFGSIDFAALFDIVAISCWNGCLWKFISVKHYSGGKKYSRHQDEIREFKQKYGRPQGMAFELWIWKPPAYQGRGKNKEWNKGGFERIRIE